MQAQMTPRTRPTLAIFASDKGPGDPERASIMSQAGAYFARRGARIVCLAEQDLCVPVVTSARSAGGELIIVGAPTFTMPSALGSIPFERLDTANERMDRIIALADVFVGLPGSLASAAQLYSTWTRAGGGESGKRVVLLNRNRAFEVVRGYFADVMAHGMRNPERFLQFSDSVEDLWNRVNRAL